MKIFTAIFSLICIPSCANSNIVKLNDCIRVDEFISKANEINNSSVSVCGYYIEQFEDNNLYLSKTDKANHKMCISVGRSKDLKISLAEYDGKFVMIKGIATNQFCPNDSICFASCSSNGIFVDSIEKLGN